MINIRNRGLPWPRRNVDRYKALHNKKFMAVLSIKEQNIQFICQILLLMQLKSNYKAMEETKKNLYKSAKNK